MRPDRRLFLAALGTALWAGAAQAGPHEAAADIAAAIDARLGDASGQVMPNGGAMMPACTGQLAVKWLPSGNVGFRTASVSCPQPAWTIYAGVRISQSRRVLVATRAIAPGGLLDTHDTALRDVQAGSLGGTALSPAALGHAHAARAITAGQPLTRQMTDLQTTVQSGERVELRVNASGISVSAPGVALQDGAVGDSVEVENAASHRRLTATIVRSVPAAPGTYLVAADDGAD